ncbi:MAG: hypothetical protein ACR2GY_01325, partial [Phycisphaerales bacterium]
TIHTFPAGTTEATMNHTIDDASVYINATTGEIELRMKHIVIATFSTSGFIAEIDRVRIGVE